MNREEYQAFQKIRDHIDKCRFCDKLKPATDIKHIGKIAICNDCIYNLKEMLQDD